MKKLCIILASVCMIYLTACTETVTAERKASSEDASVQINMETKATETSEVNSDVLINKTKKLEIVDANEYYELVSNNLKPGALIDFIEKNMLHESSEEMSDILESLIHYMKGYEGVYQELIQNSEVAEAIYNMGDQLNVEKVEETAPGYAKDLLSDILEGGFLLVESGEYYDVKIDFAVLMEISQQMKGPVRDYIELKYYSDTFFERMADQSPVDSDELVEMIIRAERHLKEWPQTAYKTEINELHKIQTTLYFLGSTDYEVFDYGTNRMKPEYLEAMMRHINEYRESEFGKLGIKYMIALEDRDYGYHPEYFQLVENYKRFGLESDLTLIEKAMLDHSRSVFLPQLQGHENIDIQERINAILRAEEAAIEADCGYTPESEGSFYYNAYIYTSNPNLLSMECLGSHNMKDWTRDKIISRTLNFDLKTGESMTLDRFLKQEVSTLDEWLLPIVNEEFEKYFPEESGLQTLADAEYVIMNDALLVIGEDSTQRAYVPIWKLNEYLNWSELVGY